MLIGSARRALTKMFTANQCFLPFHSNCEGFYLPLSSPCIPAGFTGNKLQGNDDERPQKLNDRFQERGNMARLVLYRGCICEMENKPEA